MIMMMMAMVVITVGCGLNVLGRPLCLLGHALLHVIHDELEQSEWFLHCPKQTRRDRVPWGQRVCVLRKQREKGEERFGEERKWIDRMSWASATGRAFTNKDPLMAAVQKTPAPRLVPAQRPSPWCPPGLRCPLGPAVRHAPPLIKTLGAIPGGGG